MTRRVAVEPVLGAAAPGDSYYIATLGTDAPDVLGTEATRRSVCGELSLPSKASSVTRARQAARLLARRSGCSAATQAKVALAVTEAVTNAIIHGYARGSGRVRLVAESSADEFVVSVSDTGCGLTPRSDSPGLGLGLTTITQVTTEFLVDTRPGQGTRLRMAFRLP